MKDEELDSAIEKSFSTEPEYNLPVDFAQFVTSAVVRREQWKNDLYEYLYFTAISIFLLVIISGTYYLVNKDLLMQFFTFISQNVVQVVFVVFILNFILFADRVLLRLLFRSLPLPLRRRGEKTGTCLLLF